jgi:hypothetical protein
VGKNNRLKGRRFQSAIRDHLKAAGLRVIEEGGAGLAGGDLMILGGHLLAVECKSGRTQLGTDWRQAEARAMGTNDIPVLIHKRHGVGNTGEQWVTLTVDEFARLLKRVDG